MAKKKTEKDLSPVADEKKPIDGNVSKDPETQLEIVEHQGEVTPVVEIPDEKQTITPVPEHAVIVDPEVKEDPLDDVTVTEDGKKPKKSDSHSHTRFGEGKEVNHDHLSNPASERHYDHTQPEFVQGRVNEYPR